MIFPPFPARIISRPTRWAMRNVPVRLMSITFLQVVSCIFSAHSMSPTPALFTSISILPTPVNTALTASFTESERAISTANARPFGSFSATARARSRSTSSTHTVAPRCAKSSAVARPMPEPPPVITATLPSSRKSLQYGLLIIFFILSLHAYRFSYIKSPRSAAMSQIRRKTGSSFSYCAARSGSGRQLR